MQEGVKKLCKLCYAVQPDARNLNFGDGLGYCLATGYPLSHLGSSDIPVLHRKSASTEYSVRR